MITLVGQVPGTKNSIPPSHRRSNASLGRKYKEARGWDDERKQPPGTAGGRGGEGHWSGGDTFTSTLWVSPIDRFSDGSIWWCRFLSAEAFRQSVLSTDGRKKRK